MRIPTIPARDSNLKAATIPIEGGQYWPVGTFMGSQRWRGVKTGSFGCDLSHAVSFQREPVSVVHEAVEDGIGDGGIADHLVPMVNR